MKDVIMTYQTNNLVYHYTTIEVLLKLLDNIEDGKMMFHASYIQYMNDPFELTYGIKQVMSLLPEIENKFFVENKDRLSHVLKNEEFRNEYLKILSKSYYLPFVVCFCNNRDYLPQWEMYGDKGKGVSIGFDIQDYYRYITHKSGRIIDMTHFDDGKLRAIKVSYKQISRNHFFISALKLYYHFYLKGINGIYEEEAKWKQKLATLTNIAFYLSSLIKHKAYSYELESRIIYPCSRIEDIKFKTNSENKLVPYVEVGIETERFKKIVIGPCCDYDNTKFMLETRLKQLGLEHVKILQSKIPFRA